METSCNSRMHKRTAVFVFSATLVGIAAFLVRERILLAIGHYLITQDVPKHVDVIHVIAGEDYRTYYAIDLYKRGYARYLFFTGGWCKAHGWHGRHGRQLALENGVPADAIVIDDTTVTSTYAEAVLLKAWMDNNSVPIRSVIVVSDPFHMRRAKWTYSRVLGKETEITMEPVPFEQTPYQERWWEDEASKRYVQDEYKKSLYYLMRYQLAWGKFKDWLASFDVN